ncbi:tyrosine-type recombinase/integrase [Patescibacteria group bacterium]|nr:tyrosine-type recombinase/integrase [Patescibacteria group bacterium]
MADNLKVLLNSFLEHLEVEKNCSQLTIRNYKHYWDEYIKFLSNDDKRAALLSDVTVESVRKFRLLLARRNLKTTTQAYYVIAIRSLLKWLSRNDISALAAEKLDVPKQRDQSLKFLNEKQVYHLLNQPLDSTEKGLRDRTIMELLFSTGLRVSELVALNKDQIDLESREFGVVGKGGRARVVFISLRVIPYLRKYLNSRTDKFKALFINLKKRSLTDSNESVRLSSRSIQRMVRFYVKQAKLPVEATPHTLRHSLATGLLRSGADLRSVQEILGHKNIATTQIYTHVTDAQLKQVHEKYHQGNKIDNFSP